MSAPNSEAGSNSGADSGRSNSNESNSSSAHSNVPDSGRSNEISEPSSTTSSAVAAQYMYDKFENTPPSLNTDLAPNIVIRNNRIFYKGTDFTNQTLVHLEEICSKLAESSTSDEPQSTNEEDKDAPQ